MTDTTHTPDDDRDGRAAEYVLGTLALADRLAFETAIERDPELARMVASWSARLQPLADSVAAEAPPPSLKPRVLDRIASDAPAVQRPFSLARWFGWTFGLSALAAAAAVALVFLLTPRPFDVGGFAMLHRSGGSSSDVIAFQIDRDRRNMVVLASATVPEAGHDYELWILPPNKPPISLGVVKVGDRAERALSPAATAEMTDFTNMAISLEPAGGSPSGAPTGPVVFTGVMRLMANLVR